MSGALFLPSPPAGEGARRADEGLAKLADAPLAYAELSGGNALRATPHPAQEGHLLPQGEKGEAATLYICIACKGEGAERPGPALLAAVRQKLRAHTGHGIAVEPVDCLAVCKRPCTIALVGAGKWTYVVGDLTGDAVDDVTAATLAYAATANGMIPWRARPQSFRKGIVSRIPPLNFAHNGAGVPLEPTK